MSRAEGPLVSVLLASRNGERHLGATLEALAAQTWPAVELVAVDDGSSDRTRALLEGFAGARGGARVLCADGVGPAAARDLAARAARGELLAVQDDDDLPHPERLERQARHLAEHPGTVLVGSAAHIVDESGERAGPYRVPMTPAAIRRTLRRAPPFVHSAVCMRRSAYLAAGGYRAPFRASEDYDLYLRIAEHGALANLREPLCSWRRHGGSSTARARRDQLDYLALARVFARERRETGRDSIERFAAVGDVGRFLDVYPRAGWLAFYLGEAYVREGRLPEARRHLGRALELGPARVQALAWWLLSWPVAGTPRAARARAAVAREAGA